VSQGRDKFVEELRELGFAPELSASDETFLWFPYQIPNGPRSGDVVELGFQVPTNFEYEPPHGPCYRPAILRNDGLQGVHPDRPAAGWDHWSRPHPRWAQTDKTVRAYMRFIRALNRELPKREHYG
jgi:hypothetical protein